MIRKPRLLHTHTCTHTTQKHYNNEKKRQGQTQKDANSLFIYKIFSFIEPFKFILIWVSQKQNKQKTGQTNQKVLYGWDLSGIIISTLENMNKETESSISKAVSLASARNGIVCTTCPICFTSPWVQEKHYLWTRSPAKYDKMHMGSNGQGLWHNGIKPYKTLDTGTSGSSLNCTESLCVFPLLSLPL